MSPNNWLFYSITIDQFANLAARQAQSHGGRGQLEVTERTLWRSSDILWRLYCLVLEIILVVDKHNFPSSIATSGRDPAVHSESLPKDCKRSLGGNLRPFISGFSPIPEVMAIDHRGSSRACFSSVPRAVGRSSRSSNRRHRSDRLPSRSCRPSRQVRPVAAHPSSASGLRNYHWQSSIASVNVQGGNLLVVTGKTFGVTNIIALDADKNVIQDQRVIVEQDDRRTVVVYRGRYDTRTPALQHAHRRRSLATPNSFSKDDQGGAGQGRRVGAGERCAAAVRVRKSTLQGLTSRLPRPLNCDRSNT